MVSIEVLFSSSIIVGAIAIISALYTLKYRVDPAEKAIKLRCLALILLCAGFIIHTSGDYFGSIYSNEVLELQIESFAHIILFISFFVYAISAKRILEFAKEYGFG